MIIMPHDLLMTKKSYYVTIIQFFDRGFVLCGVNLDALGGDFVIRFIDDPSCLQYIERL